MNAVIVAIFIMLFLSLTRVHVVISLLIGAIAGGLTSHLSWQAFSLAFDGGVSKGIGLSVSYFHDALTKTLGAFEEGVRNGAAIALSYALLGAFAVAISKSGLPHALADAAVKQLTTSSAQARLKWILILLIGAISVSSQNLIPIHIAFIPLVIPPLLYVMARLQLDRRMIACIMAFGLVTPYMFLPVGFGSIFLNEILLANVQKGGMDVAGVNVMRAMLLPALSMFCGLLIAIFISYRKPRTYDMGKIENAEKTKSHISKRSMIISVIAILVAFGVQLYTGSMMLGALLGFLLFTISGSIKWSDADHVFTEGIKMMAMIGLIMITAQGFAEVLKQTGDIESLVKSSAAIFAGNKVMAAFAMMAVGLIITMGIGSAFSTVPIIAAIYVPLCIEMNFSVLGTVCLIGAAAAIGDAGSPASDSTVGATAGLNVDNQHDHIKDTVIPTFIHYNIPLFIAGWIAPLVI